MPCDLICGHVLAKAGRIGVDRCCSSPYRPNGDGVRGYWAGE